MFSRKLRQEISYESSVMFAISGKFEALNRSGFSDQTVRNLPSQHSAKICIGTLSARQASCRADNGPIQS